MEERLLPHHASIDAGTVAEERRLAYVGITRAQSSLTFVLARRRRRFGEDGTCLPSRFLTELPGDLLAWHGEAGGAGPDPSRARATLAGLRQHLTRG
jgi:ATP-dependent DNA helicase Rep